MSESPESRAARLAADGLGIEAGKIVPISAAHPGEKIPPCSHAYAALQMKMGLPAWQGSAEDVSREFGFDAPKLRRWLRRANRDLRRYFEEETPRRGERPGAKQTLHFRHDKHPTDARNRQGSTG